jgi:hypothetical protein
MGKEDVSPTCKFTAPPEVGLEATVGILQTRYPSILASSQEKGPSVHPCATMRLAAPDPASLLRRAPALPRISWLQSPPPYSGGLQRYHTSRDPPRAVNKEMLRHNRHAARLAHYRGTPTCYRGICKMCE